MKYIIFTVFLLFSLTCNHQQVSAYEKSYREIKETIQRKKGELIDQYFSDYARRSGFNGVILVSENNRVLFKNAYGVENKKTKKALSTQSIFQLASVSKQFTASAIMLLEQRGALAYDDSVQTYIPDFPYVVTIRQLLTHRAGLSNYAYFCEKHWKGRSVPLTNKDVIALYCKHQPDPYYPPGKRFDYSNTGYVLLASIVEIITKKSFADFMQQEFFSPLGMKNTYVYQYGITENKPMLTSGHESRYRLSEINYLDGVVGDKGVYSTVEDLYLWDQALYSHKILNEASLNEAFNPGSPEKRYRKKNYGFGWRLRKNEKEEEIVYHRGWWHGYKSLFLRNTSKKNTIIILSNIASNNFLHINGMEDILNEEKLNKVIAGIEGNLLFND